MIGRLREQADVLMTHGWTRREAEWLALVYLHSGVFFRSQHLAFIGRTNPALANRFIRRCRKYAVEPWKGSRLRLCRIAARRIYRVLGAEHVRHRRTAAPEVLLRRLLSLDYLLEHPHAAWLPTEEEKVYALAAAGRAVEVVVVGRHPVRLAAAERVLDRWASTPLAPEAVGREPLSRVAERGARRGCHPTPTGRDASKIAPRLHPEVPEQRGRLTGAPD